MTVWEIAFLTLILVAFGLFSAVIAYASWCTSQVRRPKKNS